MFSFRKLRQATASIMLAAVSLSIINPLVIGSAWAAELTQTPTNQAAGDITTLRNQLLSTDTSATLEPVKKFVNGVETEGCFNTGSGFVLIRDDLGNWEFASYGSKSCNSTTNVTTLSSMRRGLNPTNPGFGSGTGLTFDAGAQIEVTDWPVFYNYALYKDILNTTTGSGGIKCGSSSQPCFFTAGVTTAQRDAFTFGTSPGYYPEIFNTTLGVRQYWDGSSWINYGSGSTINATLTIAGKVQIANTGAILNATATGSTGAWNVIPALYATSQYRIYTPAQLRGGTGATTNVATWAGVSNGSFNITIDGTARSITGINFTGVASMTGVALTIQTAIRTVTSGQEVVTWTQGTGTGFTIKSGLTATGSAITKASAQGAGTDISGAGGTAYMDADAGSANTVTVTNATINEPAHAGRVVALNSSGEIDTTLLPSSISVNNLNSGTNANNLTFWRGDGRWAYPNTIFGTGSLGSVTWSTTTNLNPANEYAYSGATLNAGVTLSVSQNNKPLRLKTTGNVTINGTIDLNAKGASGGLAVSSTDTTGNSGNAGGTMLTGVTGITGGGAGGGFQNGTNRGGGGGGGASMFTAGSNGSTDNGATGGAGATIPSGSISAALSAFNNGVICGGGGASGGRSNAGTSGAGGLGGGCMIWHIGGNLTLGASSVIRANGAVGGDANGSGGGDGGGGGGGVIFIIVAGSITNNGATLSASGGAGGTGGISAEGGAGGAGKVIIYSLSTGQIISS